jgi:hypothetical protein
VAVTVATVKARLNKTLTVDDAEIQEMLDAAVAEYESLIGPTSATTHGPHVVTPRVLSDGLAGFFTPVTPLVSLTSVTDRHGTAVAAGDFVISDVESGQVRPASGGVLSFATSWPSPLVVTYVAGGLTANRREVIVADVAGYFAATQRGSTVGALPAGAGGFYATEGSSAPLESFPRIKALAAALTSSVF